MQIINTCSNTINKLHHRLKCCIQFGYNLVTDNTLHCFAYESTIMLHTIHILYLCTSTLSMTGNWLLLG